MATKQVVLDADRIEKFYHDAFVQTQVEHFVNVCLPALKPEPRVVDVGGGCGFFARDLASSCGARCLVIDTDPESVRRASLTGVEAIVGDALEPPIDGTEDAVCFNLILHHLVAGTNRETTNLQASALDAWRGSGAVLFVNEYIYDSLWGDAAGRLIYAVTSNRVASWLGSVIATVVPTLRANTFGVGVRFRGEKSWRRLFERSGWRVAGYARGAEEVVSLPRRLLMIRSCRRDSFVLVER